MSINNIKPPVRNKLISFFHIPKTAGTNFTYVIKNNYPNCRIDDKGFQAIDRRTDKVMCTWGHGGHYNSINNDSTMFVFLRDPVDRVVSHFVEHKGNRYTNPNFTLEEMFLNKPDLYLGDKEPPAHVMKRAGISSVNWGKDFYCRALSGSGYLSKGPFSVGEETKDEIIKNLQDNIVVLTNQKGERVKIPTVFGITENFDDSLKLFAKIAGWNRTDYKEHSQRRAFNHGKRRYPASDKLLEAIREHNSYDIEIYEEAKKLFEKELVHFGIKEGKKDE